MNILNNIFGLGSGGADRDPPPTRGGSLKRDREETYLSSSGPEEEEDSNSSESEVSPLTQIPAEQGGKLLIKNCFVWQWNDDGIALTSESEGRVISGELVFLACLAVDHFGRISRLLQSAGPSSLDESLYETVVDARQRVLLPGLMDAHLHVMSTGESAYYLDLDHCRSIQELQEALRRHHDQNPSLPWIIGINWDQVSPRLRPSLWLTSTRPTCPATPPDTTWTQQCPMCQSSCGERAGISVLRTPSPCAAEASTSRRPPLPSLAERCKSTLRDQPVSRLRSPLRLPLCLSSVSPLSLSVSELMRAIAASAGLLKETAVRLVLSAQSEKTESEREKFITEGLQLCLRSGLTAVQTNDDYSFETYQDLAKSAAGLPIRVPPPLLQPLQPPPK
jgi:hypothetical protein